MSEKSKRRPLKEQLSSEEGLRLLELTAYEERAFLAGYRKIAGIDEAGRGPLAGPVVAAACILPRGYLCAGVDDSKKLSPVQRVRLFELLTNDPEVSYGIGIVSPQEIDRINIYQATIVAMKAAVAALPEAPDYILCDGMKLMHEDIPCEKIIRGDSLSQSIAAASILAKVTRDRMMLAFHEQWPHYGFDRHKGYGTERHLDVLRERGPCAIHRMTFGGVC